MLKVAFVDQPDVRFGLSLVGGDIDLIPGASEAGLYKCVCGMCGTTNEFCYQTVQVGSSYCNP